MRLSKRLAVGVMAAVMALSMLTACGGGNPNENPSSSSASNASSNSSSSASSGSNSNSSSSSASTGSENKENTHISSKDSRAAKYFNRREKMTQYTYKAQIETTAHGETSNKTIKVVTDGVRDFSYMKGSFGSTNEFTSITDKRTKMVSFIPKNSDGSDGKEVYQYSYTNSNINSDYGNPQYIESVAMQGDPRKSSYPVTVGTTMVDGTLYYSETYGPESGIGTKWTYCFDAGDVEGNNLRYAIMESSWQMAGMTDEKVKIKIIENTTNVDYKLLQVPEGYEIVIHKEDNGTWWERTKETTPKDNYPN